MNVRTRTRTRTTGALTLVAALLLSVSGLAIAAADESVTILTAVGGAPGTRDIEVTNLVGEPLESLSLNPGRERPFRVRVTDNLLDPDYGGFTVTAHLSNLYLLEDPEAPVAESNFDWNQEIGAQQVNLSYGTSAPVLSDLAAELRPILLLSSDGAIDCDLLRTLETASEGGGLLGGLPLVGGLLGELNDVVDSLCVALAGDSITIDEVEVLDDVLDQVFALDLASLAPVDLPFAIQGQDSGNFAAPHGPDFASAGVGEWAAANLSVSSPTTGTGRVMLHGEPFSLSGSLKGLIDAATAALIGSPLVSATGADALLSLEDLVEALSSSTDAGANELMTLIGTVGEISDEALAMLLGEVLSFELADATDMLGLSGRYQTLPKLRLDLPQGVESGQYAGTMTVRIYDGQLD